VCADGGNPDPTSTHGKVAKEAKALELKGWPYPRHLAGRHFGIVVHGDSVGAESLRRSLATRHSCGQAVLAQHESGDGRNQRQKAQSDNG